MISFEEFFNENVNPHHMRDSRLTNRFGGPRDGKLQGTNIVAKRYKKNDPNFNQNKVQKTGSISQGEALKLIGKHKLNHTELHVPKQLGKRPFTLQKLANGGYIIQKINKP